jgi:hypothetical protein
MEGYITQLPYWEGRGAVKHAWICRSTHGLGSNPLRTFHEDMQLYELQGNLWEFTPRMLPFQFYTKEFSN